MITNFPNKVFLLERLIKWFYANIIYFFSLGLTRIFIASGFDVTYRINLREFLLQLELITNIIFVFNLSFVCCLIDDAFLFKDYLCVKCDFNGVRYIIDLDRVAGNNKRSRLDISNSFLYSYKTEALLE